MRRYLIVTVLSLWACSGGGSPPTLPPGTDDGGGVDAGQPATGLPDAGGSDGGITDAGVVDAGGLDAGATDAGDTQDGGAVAPVTTAAPAGGQYTGALTVTLISTPAATITYTTDGSDPTTSMTAKSGPSPVLVTLSAPSQVTVTFFAQDAAGHREVPHSESYSLLEETTPASISGTLITHPLLETPNAQAVVLLFDHDPASGSPSPILTQTVSPSAPTGASYVFQGLPAGRYWVVAGWWPGTPAGNPQAFAAARVNPIDLDPAVPARQRADFVNVYLGECDPQGTGVDGTVVLGSDLLSETAVVSAYQQALTLANISGVQNPAPQFVEAAGSGSQRPFAMCGLPPGSLNLLASATSPGAPAPTDSVAYSSNPVSITQVTHVVFYLDTPDPTAGGVSGTVTMSGPLPNGSVAMIVMSSPWSSDSPLVGFSATEDFGSPVRNDYSVEGLADGTYYLTAVATDDAGTNAVSALNVPFTISAGTKQATVNVNVNVGRVHGNIDVQNASNAPAEVAVGTPPSIMGGAPDIVGAAQVQLGAADANGVSHGTYDIFGIADGSYKAIAAFQIDGDTTFDEAFKNGHYLPSPLMLPAVSIMGGTNVEVDIIGTVP